MEEEARVILRKAGARRPDRRNFASIVLARFGPPRGEDLESPPREPAHEPPRFD